MTVTPLGAATGVLVIGAGLVAALLWAMREPPRTRIELPLDGGPDRLIWLCTQPATLDEATARAKAAMQALETRSQPSVQKAAEAMTAAMNKANAEGGVPTELRDITQELEAAADSLSRDIDAEFGCTLGQIVSP